MNIADRYEELKGLWINLDDKSLEVRTSGSTGKPKLIRLPKKLLKASALRSIKYFGIDHDWINYSCLSPEHIGGIMVWIRAMVSLSFFECEEPSNTPHLRTARESIDKQVLVSVVPSQMWHILKLNLNPDEKKRIRFLIGGSSIPQILREEILANGLQAWESYGMTETASHIALRPITEKNLYFEPLSGITLSKSAKGTLTIQLVQGESPIVTNDLVEFDADGNFKILGRADNVINTGGLKIIPEQLEEKIREIIRESRLSDIIADIMVSSKPDDKWGEAMILKFESKGKDSVDRTGRDDLKYPSKEEISIELEDLLRRELSKKENSSLLKHELPKEIISVNRLPRTENGKLKRRTPAN